MTRGGQCEYANLGQTNTQFNNVLKLFVHTGLVQEIVIDGGRTYFDSNAGHHAHFYNIDTGELIDFQMPEGAELPDLQSPPGTRIESVDLVVRISSKPE